MDIAFAAVVFGFLGTVVSVIGGIIVAALTSRNEKKQVAETTIEKTLRERIALRDEQLQDKDEQLEEKDRTIEQQSEQIEALKAANEALAHIVSELQEGIQ